eukprot:scaffold23868_cov109-Isochrysis_galbana.AAC.3
MAARSDERTPSSMTAVPCSTSDATTIGHVRRIWSSTAGLLLMLPEPTATNAVANVTTQPEMSSMVRTSWAMVGCAATRSKVGPAGAKPTPLAPPAMSTPPVALMAPSTLDPPPRRLDPTSPNVKHVLATEYSAVCAAAAAPPSIAAEAAAELCIVSFAICTKKKGAKPRNVGKCSAVTETARATFIRSPLQPSRIRSRRQRTQRRRAAAQYCEATVAHAAPTTPRPSITTRTRSSEKLTSAARMTDCMGLRVSFWPISTA